MKNIIVNLNKAFDHRIRLGIMSMLVVNDWMDFTSLKDLLELTDGNLASHLKALEAEAYIEVKKQFVARKPQTTYSVTTLGKTAFDEHLDALEAILKNRG
jgi:DNA-binding HxlR family transcriptional regulator